MDRYNSHEKITDSNTIKMPDGRVIMVFTIQRDSVWFCIVYDHTRNIVLKTPFLDYQQAFNKFVTICKLLDCEHKDVQEEESIDKLEETPASRVRIRGTIQGDMIWKLIWVGIALTFAVWAISR